MSGIDPLARSYLIDKSYNSGAKIISLDIICKKIIEKMGISTKKAYLCSPIIKLGFQKRRSFVCVR